MDGNRSLTQSEERRDFERSMSDIQERQFAQLIRERDEEERRRLEEEMDRARRSRISRASRLGGLDAVRSVRENEAAKVLQSVVRTAQAIDKHGMQLPGDPGYFKQQWRLAKHHAFDLNEVFKWIKNQYESGETTDNIMKKKWPGTDEFIRQLLIGAKIHRTFIRGADIKYSLIDAKEDMIRQYHREKQIAERALQALSSDVTGFLGLRGGKKKSKRKIKKKTKRRSKRRI